MRREGGILEPARAQSTPRLASKGTKYIVPFHTHAHDTCTHTFTRFTTCLDTEKDGMDDALGNNCRLPARILFPCLSHPPHPTPPSPRTALLGVGLVQVRLVRGAAQFAGKLGIGHG